MQTFQDMKGEFSLEMESLKKSHAEISLGMRL